MAAVTEIAPRIYRVSLPHPYLAAANVYLIRDEVPALIDTGHFNAGARNVLAAALNQFGLGPEDLGYIFLTDVYPERVGGVLAWEAGSKSAEGANSVMPGLGDRFPAVVGHRGARRAAADYGLFSAELCRMLLRPLEEDHRMAERLHPEAMELLVSRAYRVGGSFPLTHPVATKASFALGERVVYALPLGGTSGAHMGYWLEPDGVLFSGDLTLGGPSELPFLCQGQAGTSAGYMRSLGWACGLAPERLLPATGEPDPAPALTLHRLRRLLDQERENLPALLLSGPRDLATLLALKTMGERLSPLRTLRRMHTLLALLHQAAGEGLIEALHDEGKHTYRLGRGSMMPYRSRAAGH